MDGVTLAGENKFMSDALGENPGGINGGIGDNVLGVVPKGNVYTSDTLGEISDRINPGVNIFVSGISFEE